jgi:uncharacterized protein YbaP (TraB family)
MKLSTTVILAFCWLATATAATAEIEDRSFLWRAVSGERSVYLLGSIHFMKADSYPLSPAVENAFEIAETVVFEADLDQLNRAAVLMLAEGTLEGDAILADVVSQELYREVSKRLEAAGMSIGNFTKMKPWMLALSLTSFELMRAGYLGGEGVDAHFDARAKNEGKRRDALESVEFQVSLFADLTDEESEEFLRYTLVELDAVIPVVDEIVATWKAGDPTRMEALLAEGFDEYEGLYERMVTDRNLAWLPKIEGLLEGDADAMVVVGSLHLVGKRGLIELLRAKGYEVEQL